MTRPGPSKQGKTGWRKPSATLKRCLLAPQTKERTRRPHRRSAPSAAPPRAEIAFGSPNRICVGARGPVALFVPDTLVAYELRFARRRRLYVFRTLLVDDPLAAVLPGVHRRVRLLLSVRTPARIRASAPSSPPWSASAGVPISSPTPFSRASRPSWKAACLHRPVRSPPSTRARPSTHRGESLIFTTARTHVARATSSFAPPMKSGRVSRGTPSGAVLDEGPPTEPLGLPSDEPPTDPVLPHELPDGASDALRQEGLGLGPHDDVPGFPPGFFEAPPKLSPSPPRCSPPFD